MHTASKKAMQCSWLRFMARHSSGKLVNTVFFVPSRATCGKGKRKERKKGKKKMHSWTAHRSG